MEVHSMPELRSPVKLVRGVPVVIAPGQLDITTANLLRASLVHLTACGYATIAVDMSRTEFCDSVGLTVLVRAHKRAVAEGGELRLVLPASAVRRIFTATGLDCLIRTFRNVADAVADLPAVAIGPCGYARQDHADLLTALPFDRAGANTIQADSAGELVAAG
jgi:anti-sigma B factor antagonist